MGARSLKREAVLSFSVGCLPKAKGPAIRPFAFDCFWKLPKFHPNSARAVAFLPCVGRVKRGPCRPSTPRAAGVAPPPASTHALQRTLGLAHGAVPHSVAGPLAHAPEQPWDSHWLPCSQVCERDASENGLAGLARAPGAPAPTPPTIRSVAHISHAHAPHIADLRFGTVASAGRCGRGAAERRDGRGVNG